MKYFQLKGISYYVIAPNEEIAVLLCLKNYWGVTIENLIEIKKIPENAKYIISI